MPKAILEFTLPDEKEEYVIATKATDYYCAIDEIKNLLRRLRKYNTSDNPELQKLLKKPQVLQTVELLETEVYKILNEYEMK